MSRDEPFQTQFRGLTTYVIPKIDVQLSATFQFKPGTGGIGGNDARQERLVAGRELVLPAPMVVPALGRPLVAGATGQSVNLMHAGPAVRQPRQPGRSARRQDPALGRHTDEVGFDLYNLFNSNPGLTWDQKFGVNFFRPTAILMPRFVRFNATVDF